MITSQRKELEKKKERLIFFLINQVDHHKYSRVTSTHGLLKTWQPAASYGLSPFLSIVAFPNETCKHVICQLDMLVYDPNMQ